MVKDLHTSHLDRKCPSQVGNVYDRPVSFQVQWVGVYGLLGGGDLVLNHNKVESFSRPNGCSIGQDGECV